MKILLGADQYPEYTNGAATFTTRLAAGLTANGHTVDLLWPAGDGRHRTCLENGVRVHRLSSASLPGRPRMQVCPPWSVGRQVRQILEIARPDVVHVQSHLGLGRALLRAAGETGVPVMATNHFMPENLLPHVPVVRRFPRTATRLAWRDLERVFVGADLLSAPTPRAVDLLAAATRLPAAQPISCGIDLDRYGVDGWDPADSGTVLFVGRLEHEKHVDELLAAFALLPLDLASRLEIIGMGSLRGELEARADALGLRDRVTFSGRVDEAELVRAYGRAAVFVMPGTAELQSLATLEAMASGRPVVAADAMALPHLVHQDENGYRYTPGDVAGLARLLARVLGNPGLRTTLGRRSRRIAEEHRLAATVGAFEDCYSRLMGVRSTGVPAPAGVPTDVPAAGDELLTTAA
ncbi:glycosyltransferase [uncultured Friedmanniella sp.]|uniref:glycosyltransferase n=1 Tax=uncultured Friedmanniella sp. TaxID=335381 RepID=UPI0035CAD240